MKTMYACVVCLCLCLACSSDGGISLIPGDVFPPPEDDTLPTNPPDEEDSADASSDPDTEANEEVQLDVGITDTEDRDIDVSQPPDIEQEVNEVGVDTPPDVPEDTVTDDDCNDMSEDTTDVPPDVSPDVSEVSSDTGPDLCTPACDGESCGGDDGCGGVCGCTSPAFCWAGKCLTCVPGCQNKECGDDGCGSSCGTCFDTWNCIEGTCTCTVTNGGVELCDDIDNDCDGVVDDDCGDPCTADSDCDDGAPCTDDVCTPTGCANIPNDDNCADYPCTDGVCVPFEDSYHCEQVPANEGEICAEYSTDGCDGPGRCFDGICMNVTPCEDACEGWECPENKPVACPLCEPSYIHPSFPPFCSCTCEWPDHVCPPLQPM